MDQHAFADDIADGHSGIQRRIGILENDLQVFSQLSEFLIGQPRQVDALFRILLACFKFSLTAVGIFCLCKRLPRGVSLRKCPIAFRFRSFQGRFGLSPALLSRFFRLCGSLLALRAEQFYFAGACGFRFFCVRSLPALFFLTDLFDLPVARFLGVFDVPFQRCRFPFERAFRFSLRAL